MCYLLPVSACQREGWWLLHQARPRWDLWKAKGGEIIKSCILSEWQHGGVVDFQIQQTCCRDEQFAGKGQWGDCMLVNQSRQAACEDSRKWFKSLPDISFMCSDISGITHDVLQINRHKKSNARHRKSVSLNVKCIFKILMPQIYHLCKCTYCTSGSDHVATRN